MTAKEYASTLKGKSITAAYIGPLRLLQNAEMDSTYLPEVINDIREYQAKQTDLDLGLEDDDDDAHWVDNSFPDLADLMNMDLPDPELPEGDPDDDWLYTD